jgi:fluoride ion exporter CrcB/FEX
MNFVFVILGGGLGALLRYLISQGIGRWLTPFPAATLLVNAAGRR